MFFSKMLPIYFVSILLSAQQTGIAQMSCLSVTTSSEKALLAFQQGIAAEKEFDYEEAGRYFLEAVEEDGLFFAAYVHYGLLLMAEEQIDKAMASFQRANATTYTLTNYETLLKAVSLNLINRSATSLVEFGNQLVELYPDCADAHYRKAMWSLLSGNGEGGVVASRKGLQLDPDANHLVNLLGQSYLKAGNAEKAMTYFEEYVVLQPSNPYAFESRGDCYLSLRQYKKAVEQYELALSLDESRVHARIKAAKAKRFADYGE